MRIAVSGADSSGRTSTVTALSYYTGMPRTLAPPIHHTLSETLPGTPLADVTPAQFLQLTLRRHTARAVQEALLGDHFVSDGSSLQEWLHAAARVMYGMNPAAKRGQVARTPDEMIFFARVVEQYGQAVKAHVETTYDAYVHVPSAPPAEPYQATMDQLLLVTLDDLHIPHHVAEGPLTTRLKTIADHYALRPVMTAEEAIERAHETPHPKRVPTPA
ncbi:AAA family ATPase [Streptomyces justiciae]|uniref:AAA family ATPase n=1 Tax=Streptomyces justiciae TaxID=2780140 RepID=A0ABU3M7N4_9ACTN|nr:AAA family ATPase [Streptomyces justiciae]MDT7847509.1 AAA family ATPase [Streptomyces justiciae]